MSVDDSGPATDFSQDQPLPEDVRRQVYVVLAAYNEAVCIERVVRNVRALYPNVVVVDDGSEDETCQLASGAGAVVLRHIINRGQGAALQTGIEYALSQGASYLVTFDGDGQHRVEDVARLIRPIRSGEFEVTLGSRFLGDAGEVPTGRRLLLRLGVLFTRLVSGAKITDTHNGLRAFSSRAAGRLRITLDRMAHASELIDSIHRSGLPYCEVPVRVRYTKYSRSKGQRFSGAIKILVHYLFGRHT